MMESVIDHPYAGVFTRPAPRIAYCEKCCKETLHEARGYERVAGCATCREKEGEA